MTSEVTGKWTYLDSNTEVNLQQQHTDISSGDVENVLQERFSIIPRARNMKLPYL